MKRYLILVASLVGMWANSAGASVIVSLTGIVPDGALWDWTYVASVQPDQKVAPGDFFTVYDFRDIVSTSFGASLEAPGTTFVTSESLLGVTPATLSPPDDATIKNVTVTLTGGSLDPDATLGAVTLGTLIIKSHSSSPIDGFYSALSHNKLDAAVANGGSVAVAVPEPGSVTLLAMGLIACGALVFRRRMSN